MAVITIRSDKDTCIDQWWNTGYGNDGGMAITSWQYGGRPRNWRVLVGFNLATIPEGAVIESAVLKLFVQPTQQIARGRTYQIHRITESWNELLTNWRNQPAVDPTPVEANSPSVRGAFYEADVTDIFVMGSRIDFRVKDKVETEIIQRETDFYAREHTGTADDPRLVIEYTIPPPEIPPGPALTQVMDFVVPDALPEGSDVAVRANLRNAGTTSGYLYVEIEGNPVDPDRYVTVETGTTHPTHVAPGESMWLDIAFRYFKMPAWDFNLNASNQEDTSSISRTIVLGVVVPPVPPEEPPEIPPEEPPEITPIIAGRIFDVGYWYEGLESWRNLETQYVPLKMGKELYLGPSWVNDGNIALRGHVDLEVTSPTGIKHIPSAVLNQDRTTDPNNGFGVQFEPLVVNEAGTWSLRVVLTLEGSPSVIGDEKNYTFNVEEAPPLEPPEPVPPGVPPVVPPLLPPIVPPEELPPVAPPEVPMLPPDVEHMTDRLKMMLWILSDIKDEIRPIGIKANTYSILTVDLSTAHLTFQTHHRPGFAITVIKCTGIMELRIGDLTTDSITIDPLIYPQTIVIDMMDFDKLYSRNAAQPGREAVLIIWRRE